MATPSHAPDDGDDEIIRGVREARRQVFELAGGTLDGLFRLLKETEAKAALPLVSLPPRLLASTDPKIR